MFVCSFVRSPFVCRWTIGNQILVCDVKSYYISKIHFPPSYWRKTRFWNFIENSSNFIFINLFFWLKITPIFYIIVELKYILIYLFIISKTLKGLKETNNFAEDVKDTFIFSLPNVFFLTIKLLNWYSFFPRTTFCCLLKNLALNFSGTWTFR